MRADQSAWRQVYLGYLWNPLSWAMEVAALLAIILLDYADFALIVALLLVNATIRRATLSAPASCCHARRGKGGECP
jgi:H+-transporting ATPase